MYLLSNGAIVNVALCNLDRFVGLHFEARLLSVCAATQF